MIPNKLDNHIKTQLENRRLQPSSSAWERLSVTLEEANAKKKTPIWVYLGYAASVLILLGFGIYSVAKADALPENKPLIVTKVIDTTRAKPTKIKPIDILKEDKAVAIQQSVKPKVALKHQQKKERLTPKTPTVIVANLEKTTSTKQSNVLLNSNKKTDVAALGKHQQEHKEFLKNNTNTIQVNASDLLLAVLNTKETTNKENALTLIKTELKHHNINVDATKVLVEIEKEIDTDLIRNEFLNTIKTKIKTIATVIASRNN